MCNKMKEKISLCVAGSRVRGEDGAVDVLLCEVRAWEHRLRRPDLTEQARLSGGEGLLPGTSPGGHDALEKNARPWKCAESYSQLAAVFPWRFILCEKRENSLYLGCAFTPLAPPPPTKRLSV